MSWLHLHLAVEAGSEDQVQHLLQHSLASEFNITDLDGLNPLHLAAQKGNPKIVAKLLAAGAPVQQPAEKYSKYEGQTALHFAAAVGHLEVTEELLKFGADVNFDYQEGINAVETALMLAIRGQHADVALRARMSKPRL